VAKAVYQGKVAAESMQRFMEGQDLRRDRKFLAHMQG